MGFVTNYVHLFILMVLCVVDSNKMGGARLTEKYLFNMAKLFVFAIGGTGSRVMKALTPVAGIGGRN